MTARGAWLTMKVLGGRPVSQYGVFSDDFYVNMNLATELDLPPSRESVLHFFEQMRRRYPDLRNFYAREKDEYVLEEDKDSGDYRWCSIEPKRVNSGVVNPKTLEDAVEQHAAVLASVPYDLSITPLDCESLSVTMGFDFAYRGNHNEALARAIGVPTGLEKFAAADHAKMLAYEPTVHISLDSDCRTQCRISFESRTGAYQVRTGEFPEEQLSVYLTVRRYDSLEVDMSYADEMRRLAALASDMVDQYLVSEVLRPLQEVIAIG